MKPFDLEKALAGNPVLLRCGLKAFIKFKLPEPYTTKMPLIGYYQGRLGNHIEHWWFENGNSDDMFSESNLDIIGMWKEPRPRVKLDLPAPLAVIQEGQEVYYLEFIYRYNQIKKFRFNKDNPCVFELYKNGGLFATKEDAQEWVDAMKGARR